MKSRKRDLEFFIDGAEFQSWKEHGMGKGEVPSVNFEQLTVIIQQSFSFNSNHVEDQQVYILENKSLNLIASHLVCFKQCLY